MGPYTGPVSNTVSYELRPRQIPPFNDLHDAGYSSWLSESSVSEASVSSESEQSVQSELSVSLSIYGGTVVTTAYATYSGGISSYETTTTIPPASQPIQTLPSPTPAAPTSTDDFPLTSTSSTSTSSSSSTSFLTPTEVPQNVAASSTPICVGSGMDTQAIGVTAALVLGLGLGLLVWVRNHVSRVDSG